MKMDFGRVVRLAVFVFVLGAVTGQFLGIPLVLGFVETGSMSPTMEPDDGFIALPPAFLGGVDEGDVVTFDSQTIEGGRLLTHRVVDATPEGYITRGDASPLTDQQSGEPPVPRNRIVAEVLQIGGHVVVIPNLGDYVEYIRGMFASIGSRFGFGVNQMISFILVAAIAAYLLDESRAAGEKRTERSTSRRDGISGLLLVGGSVALVLTTATMSMTAASGAVALPYDSVSPAEAGSGGIPAGTTENVSVTLRNGGFVPMAATLTTSNPNAEFEQERVLIEARESRKVNLSITASNQPGRYEVTVHRNQYLPILPIGVLAELSAVSHWLAVVAVDILLALGVWVIGAKLVGRGRLRLRPARPIPFEVSLLRRMRSLYRRR